MKKIKKVFKTKFEEVPTKRGFRTKAITLREVAEGMEWVFGPDAIPTEKIDGTSTMIQDGKLFARLDAKKGRTIPEGAIPCIPAPDENSGSWPHWVPAEERPDFKWHRVARDNSKDLVDGTFEAVGPHFNGNRHELQDDVLVKHGSIVITDLPTPLTVDGLIDYIDEHIHMEGIVFENKVTGERAKVRRKDFGFKW